MKKLLTFSSALALAAFGLLTLFLSTSVIFDLFGMREKEGNYVLLVVWANFISSILYLNAAYNLVKNPRKALYSLVAVLVILLAAFIGLKIHISTGGIYEVATLGALGARIGITFLFALLAYFISRKSMKRYYFFL
jgi:hypothetical protein